MVFEAMHQNLRSALRQHGHRRGIQIDAVRTYARQMFIALRYMEKLNIMHADLKPDNIVVNDSYNVLKICARTCSSTTLLSARPCALSCFFTCAVLPLSRRASRCRLPADTTFPLA